MQHDWIRVAGSLADVGRSFYARGWVLGTSGNFSTVVSSQPFRLAITGTGLDKGRLSGEQIVVVDESGKIVEGVGQPSAEVALHLAIADRGKFVGWCDFVCRVCDTSRACVSWKCQTYATFI